MRSLLLVSGLFGALLVGCGGSGGGGSATAKDSPGTAAVELPDYSQLKRLEADTSGLRPIKSVSEFERSLKNGLRLALRDQVGAVIQTLDGQPEAAGDASLAAGSFSTTNVQVEGVDEGDFVKYDGSYLYIYSPPQYDHANGSSGAALLRILETLPATAGSRLLAELELDSASANLREMYLVQDSSGNTRYVIAISEQWRADFSAPVEDPALTAEPLIADSSFVAPGSSSVLVDFIDVRNPENPFLERSLALDGSLQGSRKIGGLLYLVQRYYPGLDSLVYQAVGDEDKLANEALIEEVPLDELLPDYSIDGGSSLSLVEPENCFVPASLEENQGLLDLTSVVAIDLTAGDISSALCLNSPVSGLYASSGNLYLGATIYDYDFSVATPELLELVEDELPVPVDQEEEVTEFTAEQAFAPYPEEYTVIHKVSLNNGLVEYRASGSVDGSLGWHQPSFRMDEHQGDLRLVTSSDNGQAPRHRLSILREAGGQRLELVSSLPNSEQPQAIGKPGERIYAVRFYGDTAYIVTFLQIDPLYKLDLSDPLAPEIAGELEIPGYSNYLQPINERWMLSVGHEVVDNRNGAVKVELFDVSGPDPVSAGGASFGKQGSWSEATSDHRAISWLLDVTGDQLRLALPIHVADTPVDWDDNYFDWSYSGLHLFSIDGLQSSVASLQEQGVVVAASREGEHSYNYGYPGARGVIHDESVFYVHDALVWSAFWDSPESAVSENSADRVQF